jgi:hemoglobin
MTRSIPRCISAIALAVILTSAVARPGGAQAATAEPSLYDRLGGLPAISLVVSDFMDVFIHDPVIMANPAVRERKTAAAAPYIKYQVTTVVCEASGGPCQYTGKNMRDAHAGLGVTAAEWDRMAQIFGSTLARHQVPERETQELFALMGPLRDDIVVGGAR